jgi:hypothetical protein
MESNGLICRKNDKLESLKESILQKYGLTEKYYFRKEKAEETHLIFCDDLEKRICDYGFLNNDIIVLEPLKMEDMIHFDLCIWNIEEKDFDAILTKDSEFPNSPLRFTSSQFLCLKKLVLIKSKSFRDLRNEILKEECFASFPYDMRITLLSEEFQPIDTIKKNESSFERMGCQPDRNVILLIEPKPSLEAQKIFLRIFRRDTLNRTYLKLSEIEFQRKHSLTELKRVLSGICGIACENLSMAVYLPHKFKWKSLDVGSSRTRRKNKKTKKHAQRQANVSPLLTLPDYSVIGIRDNSKEYSKNDDWMTEYDLCWKKRTESLQNSQRSREGTNEYGISISMDDSDSSQGD